MKKIYLIAASAILFGTVFFFNQQSGYTNSAGANPRHTGAPGESTCLSCHGQASALNQGGGTLSIAPVNANDTVFVPGQTYQLRLSLANATASRSGFQVKVVNANNAQAGTLTAGAGQRTSPSGGITYLTHSSVQVSTTPSWTISWTAPAATPGADVTFYAAVHNGTSNAASNTYTTSFVFKAQRPASLAKQVRNAVSDFKAFPNPMTDRTTLTFSAERDGNATVSLYTLAGNLIQQENVAVEAGENKVNFALNTKPVAGNYILQVKSGAASVSNRVSIY